MKPKAIFNWSGGKDSSLALYYVLKNKEYDIESLLTSMNHSVDRISMHGVRGSLLEEQATSIGIPLDQVLLPEHPSMSEYESILGSKIQDWSEKGITHSIFGDIFLEDLKKYREDQLATMGWKAVFPIWKRNTTELINEFIDLGFKAVLVCINDSYLDPSFAGREIDRDFLKDLPENVDPCGENGEYHSFVYDGPIFKTPIRFSLGESVYKTYPVIGTTDKDNCFQPPSEKKPPGFYFKDLIPKDPVLKS
ncbi:diphthine--ammonia ligase [Leptospira ilyithenensis]|uniref:Diphthine--ammonia ligase n=1 Tax=Leptospira ilyithenensis TaxID=2484901 RepID=A0A4R9LT36_9LEPT|nr:diphthine--ammonia ligase [Leptospira ilyithenensis]TGN13366.1 diphthine--ammonia ligase [Leptospira ilyithenensis]